MNNISSSVVLYTTKESIYNNINIIYILISLYVYYIYNNLCNKVNRLNDIIINLNNRKINNIETNINNNITDISNSIYEMNRRIISLEYYYTEIENFKKEQKNYNNMIVNKLVIVDSKNYSNDFTKIICDYLYDKRRKLLIEYKIENNELYIVINKDNFNKLLRFSEDRKENEDISKLRKILIETNELKLESDNYIYSLLKFG